MKRAWVVCSAALLGLCLNVSGATSAVSAAPNLTTPHTTLTVSFKSVPSVAYNRLGDSTLSVTLLSVPAAEQTQTLKLSGAPDPKDDHYWTALAPVKLSLALPPGRQTLTLNTRLFVCDKTRGLCSVQTAEQRFQVMAGRSNHVTLAAPDFGP